MSSGGVFSLLMKFFKRTLTRSFALALLKSEDIQYFKYNLWIKQTNTALHLARETRALVMVISHLVLPRFCGQFPRLVKGKAALEPNWPTLPELIPVSVA